MAGLSATLDYATPRAAPGEPLPPLWHWLYFLPATTPVESSPGRRWRDAAIAVLAGGGVGALAWAVLTRSGAGLADFFLEGGVLFAGR